MKWKFVIIIFAVFVIYDSFLLYKLFFVNNVDDTRTQYFNSPSLSQYPTVTKIIEFTPNLPTIENIFSNSHNWVATLSANNIRVLTVTGDIIPARAVNYMSEVVKKNPLWSYEKVGEILKSKKSDLLFINLESPLMDDCKPVQEGMVFCGSSKNIEGLMYLGINVASLANNHMGNYGLAGIQSTIDLLTQNGIVSTGTGSAVFKNIRGITFAFLGFNAIGGREKSIAWADKEEIKEQIGNARQLSDIVVVMFHWGTEYQSQPDAKQIELARTAIDNGADLIVSNHPHWIQPIERYKNKFIMYAHGNFVFDQMWSQKTREGVIGRYTFYDKILIDIEFLPTFIEDYGQPRFLEGKEKERILLDLKNESLKREKSRS